MEGAKEEAQADFLSCDKCGIVYAERKAIGDWIHYAHIKSGNVVPVYGKDGKKICDECMN